MEVITVNLVVMVFDQVFIRLAVGSTEAKIGTEGSNPSLTVSRPPSKAYKGSPRNSHVRLREGM